MGLDLLQTFGNIYNSQGDFKILSKLKVHVNITIYRGLELNLRPISIDCFYIIFHFCRSFVSVKICK